MSVRKCQQRSKTDPLHRLKSDPPILLAVPKPARSINTRLDSCLTMVLGTPEANLKSKSSNVLSEGKPAIRVYMVCRRSPRMLLLLLQKYFQWPIWIIQEALLRELARIKVPAPPEARL